MFKACVTGASGFVANVLFDYFDLYGLLYDKIERDKLQSFDLFNCNDFVIHLAGKAHDLK